MNDPNANLYKESLPTRAYPDGRKEWWDDGKRDRRDGPAVIKSNMEFEWWINGRKYTLNQFERITGHKISNINIPEQSYVVEYGHSDHTTIWIKDNKRHREDGPAVIFDGGELWFLNGQLHREDGAACEYTDGSKSWFLHGQEYTEQEWRKKVNT